MRTSVTSGASILSLDFIPIKLFDLIDLITGVRSYIHKHDNLLKDRISKGEPLGSPLEIRSFSKLSCLWM